MEVHVVPEVLFEGKMQPVSNYNPIEADKSFMVIVFKSFQFIFYKREIPSKWNRFWMRKLLGFEFVIYKE